MQDLSGPCKSCGEYSFTVVPYLSLQNILFAFKMGDSYHTGKTYVEAPILCAGTNLITKHNYLNQSELDSIHKSKTK